MKRLIAISTILFAGQMALAQDFTPGNIVVARLGDGTATANAVPVSLLEYNPATSVNTKTVTLPYTDPGNRMVINISPTGLEGGMSLSADGRYLIISGTDVSVGNTTTGSFNKSFARIGYDGVPSLFTMSSNVAGGYVRSAASYKGDTIYFAATTGLGLIKFGETVNGTVRFNTSGFINYFNVIGDHLYGVSTANPAVLNNFDLPASTNPLKSGGEVITSSTGVGKAYGFALLDLDNGVNNPLDGNDVLYIADQGATPGIVKMYYDASTSTWTYVGRINAGGTITGLTAKINTDGNVELYAVRGATLDNELIKIIDNSSAKDKLDGTSTITQIATAGAKYTFRSVALSPSQLSTLPLNLISFKASLSGGNAHLIWTTNAEVNVKEFAVEKSNDGSHFSLVKSIAAKNQAANTYNVTDWNIEAGTIYYRLKMINIDGAFKYSTIQAITNKGAAIISIYPNPATAHITVGYPEARKGAYLQIFNLSGKKLKEVNLKLSSTRVNLNIADFPSGQYVLTVFDGQEKYSSSLVK